MVRNKRWWFFLPAAFLLPVLLLLLNTDAKPVFSSQATSPALVVIDAGHGGVDGGAVSSDGSTVESEINLQITRRLALLLLFCGERVALTRANEGDLSSPDAATIRQKKVSDLENRVAAINHNGADVLISIHQNSLPDHPAVQGAQAFYNTAQYSGRLAATIQQALNQTVNTQKGKTEKTIDSSVYLMKNVQCTAVLVECGFLSNSIEAKQLCTDDHQKKVALSIAAGYLQFANEVGA